jgi:molybdopterin-binding protein
VARRDDAGALEVRAGGVTFLARPAELEPDARAVLVVRASDIILSLDAPGRVSAANVLRGTVRSVDAVGRAMIATIDCGVTLRAEITPAAAERLALSAGVEVWALIKARACHVLSA